jgi:hypothetical protein
MQQDVSRAESVQFFVQSLWFALVEVAELIVAGKLLPRLVILTR